LLGGGDCARRRRCKPEHVWKRFTPAKIDGCKCVARVWGLKGRGG
jgi:hypothetical protein